MEIGISRDGFGRWRVTADGMPIGDPMAAGDEARTTAAWLLTALVPLVQALFSGSVSEVLGEERS